MLEIFLHLSLALPAPPAPAPTAPLTAALPQEDAAEAKPAKPRKPKREGLPEKVEGTLPLEWADALDWRSV